MSDQDRYYRIRLFPDGGYELAEMGYATNREWELWRRNGKRAPAAVVDWVLREVRRAENDREKEGG